MLSTTYTNDFEGFFPELNFEKKKFLLGSLTKVTSQVISLGETLDIKMTKYVNILIVEDFNLELSKSAMGTFCESIICIIW